METGNRAYALCGRVAGGRTQTVAPFAIMMNPSQGNSREHQRQAIDAEIQSFEESIRVLKLRRNALAPISSLPPEVFAVIFSFVRLPDYLILAEGPDKLSCLPIAHVCHRWREIAINQPLLWSHVDFATLTSAGATEMLARAKTVPLHLEAIVPIGRWDNSRFAMFQNELQAHVSHIFHLGISAEHLHLRNTLEGLISPAPTLEYLSLANEEYQHRTIQPQVLIPDNIFAGTTPRLARLILQNCDISWKSPLLKGLRHLVIRTPSAGGRPNLSVWLDALDGMPQLKTLTLHWSTPVVPPDASFPSDVERTVTLSSLVHLDLSAPARDCGLALAHLALPALTWLFLEAKCCRWDGSDVQEILPYIARHAHGPQDSQPLQSLYVSGERTRTDILAWTKPDIDVELNTPTALFVATRSARVTFIVVNEIQSPTIDADIFDAAMTALPLDSLVTLSAQNRTRFFDKQVWLRNAPRWPLLKRVRLAPPAARGFREMLLEDIGVSESTLLPSLIKLVLVESALSERRTLRLRDALMKRVEQGVPLETLDLGNCLATNRAIELLSEIVVDVLRPEEFPESEAQNHPTLHMEASGIFFPDDDSGFEDDDEEGSDIDDDDHDVDHWGMDYDDDGVDSELEDYWEMNED